MNRVELIGNVVKEPHVINKNGIETVFLTIATNDTFRLKTGEKKSLVDYHNVVFFNQFLAGIVKTLKKGDPIFISGKLKNLERTNEDGIKTYKTSIVVDNFSGMLKILKRGLSENTQETQAQNNSLDSIDDFMPF